MDPTSSHAINAMIDNCSMKIVRIKIWQHETRSKLLNSPIIRLRTGNRYFFIVEERVGKVDDRLFSNSRKSSRKSIRVAFRALAIFYEVGRRTAIKPFPQAKMTVNDSTINFPQSCSPLVFNCRNISSFEQRCCYSTAGLLYNLVYFNERH